MFVEVRRNPLRWLLARTSQVETVARKLARVNPDEAKARKAIPVPLNGKAMSILHKKIGKQTDCRGPRRRSVSAT